MSDRELDRQVSGPIVLLAARVKEALETHPSNTLVETDYGNFFVRRIELAYSDGGDTEVEAVLVPDEGEGHTFDLYTLKPRALPDTTPKALDADATRVLPVVEDLD